MTLSLGVLREDQVGLNPHTGRLRMAVNVLEGMRQYLMAAEGSETIIREERVKNSIRKAEKDPMSQKTILRLEPCPIVSSSLDKGKGLFFGYESFESASRTDSVANEDHKIVKEAINSGMAMRWKSKPESLQTESCRPADTNLFAPLIGDSTVYRVGLFEASPSGIKPKRGRPRKRPHKSTRKPKVLDVEMSGKVLELKPGAVEGNAEKKRPGKEIARVTKVPKLGKPLVVPNE